MSLILEPLFTSPFCKLYALLCLIAGVIRTNVTTVKSEVLGAKRGLRADFIASYIAAAAKVEVDLFVADSEIGDIKERVFHFLREELLMPNNKVKVWFSDTMERTNKQCKAVLRLLHNAANADEPIVTSLTVDSIEALTSIETGKLELLIEKRKIKEAARVAALETAVLREQGRIAMEARTPEDWAYLAFVMVSSLLSTFVPNL